MSRRTNNIGDSHRGRDRIKGSGVDKEVVTSFSGRDISCKESRSRSYSVVATSDYKVVRSRRQSMVATSTVKKDGRHIIQWSQHQLKGKKVATSFSGRDISCQERRSRHHSAIMTSDTKRKGHDIIKWSRHKLQGKKVATSLSSHDIRCMERRSRHHLAVATLDPRDAKDKLQPNESLCDLAETTEVASKNLGAT